MVAVDLDESTERSGDALTSDDSMKPTFCQEVFVVATVSLQ